MEDEILTAEEVADLMKVKVCTIYQWVARKTIPFHRVSGSNKCLRFLKSEIMAHIKGE